MDIGSLFDGAPDLEFRSATEALELAESGLCYQRVPPGYRFPYGHTHMTQEEVYVVLRGSGRMKVDDEIVELEEWDAVRVPPVCGEAMRPGPRASRSSSSARRISATLRAKTSMAGATGGATNRAVRQPRSSGYGPSPRYPISAYSVRAHYSRRGGAGASRGRPSHRTGAMRRMRR